MAAKTLNVILSSHADCDVFPRNDSTRFANKLPTPLTNRTDQKFHARLRWIAFANNPEERDPSYLEVQLSQVESQRSGRSTTQRIGGFTFPLPTRLAEDYGSHTFKHSPYLPLKFQVLTSFEVAITNRIGEVATPYDRGPPTLIWIEMTDRAVDDQFTIQCFSKEPFLFPQNELDSFTSAIPSELELPSYEVALQQIVYPPGMEDRAALAKVVINGENYVFNLRALGSTQAFLDAVSAAVANGLYGRLIEFGYRPDVIKGVYFRRRRLRNDEDGRSISISPSKTFSMACGQTTVARGTTTLLPGHMFSFRGKPEIKQALPNPVAMLTCDLVKTNVLAGAKSSVLQAVPLQLDQDLHSPRLYEPDLLIYQPVQDKPFNTLRFSFLEPDGRQKELRSDNPGDTMLISLVFRKKKIAHDLQ